MSRNKLNTHDFNVETKGRLPEVHRFEHLTELARKRGEKDIETANNNIKTEYRKRLHDTKEMKSRMEHCISTLNVEIGILERCKSEVVEGLRNFEPNVALSANWNTARKGRPGSPSMHHENIVRAMAQNNDDLKNSIARLADALAQLEESLKALKQCQQYVQREINSKMATMIIDNACMEELISPLDLFGPETNPKSTSALMQSSKLHTENEWSNTATSVISTALAQIEVSQSRRKKALSLLRNITDGGRYNRNPLVLDAFQSRMKYNQAQLATLDLNISMLTGQIDQLDQQKALLVGSLEKVLAQQEIAKQRLNIRVMLPSRENTRPNVETTLEVEIVNLQRTERELRDKLAELSKNHNKQLALRTSMEKERKVRAAAFALDKQCFEMRLPSLSEAIRQSKRDDADETGSARSGRSSASSKRGQQAAPSYGDGQSQGALSAAYAVPQPPSVRPAATPSSNASGRSYARSSARSQQPPSFAAAAESGALPPIPSPPSPRGSVRQSSDVQALLRTGTPTSVRSARSSKR